MATDNQPEGYRILLIDDHPTIRQGMQFFLEVRGNHQISEASSYAETLVMLDKKPFDIAVLDLSLHEHSGIELIPMLEEANVAVLVYSMHEDFSTIDRVFKTGALGYVTKREGTEILLEAINTIAQGKRFVSPFATSAIQQRASKNMPIEDTLSDREREIFYLIGKGIGNAEIAHQLEISTGTVGTYVSRIVQKLDLGNRRALRKYAVEYGTSVV